LFSTLCLQNLEYENNWRYVFKLDRKLWTMQKAIPTVGVVIYKGDKVLLVRHGEKAEHITGVYGLPSGRLKLNETDLDAAIRELEEETGLKTTAEDLVELPKSYYDIIERNDGKKKFSLRAFVCRRCSGKLRATEETVPEWIKISEIKNINHLPSAGQPVIDGLKYK